MAGISITLAGNFQKLDELKDKASKTASSIKSAFGSNVGKAAFASLATGATVAFAGVVAAVKSAVDAGGELNDVMARTGAAGKGLLILQRAFENAGMAASQVPQVLNKLQKALTGINEEGEPTNKAFEKLGLNIDELISIDPAEALMKIGNSIASIHDPAQRTARVMEIFGKSGGELLAVFNDPGAFSGAKEQLGALADLLPGMAADADIVGDAFGGIDTKLKQLGAGVLSELMPELLAFSNWLNETDFTEAGQRIGGLTQSIMKLGGVLGEVASWTPAYQIGKFTEGALNNFGNLTDGDKAKAAKEAAGWAATDPEYMKSRTGVAEERKSTIAAVKDAAEGKKAAADAERAAMAAEKKAQADRKSADEKERSRNAAGEEYNIESRMISARLKGDAEGLARLEREKAIRSEIAKLEQAGFSRAEAEGPATAKVDAEAKIAKQDAARKDAEDSRSKAEEERQKISDILQGRLEGARSKQDGLQFQSSVGSISSMQRIGGGGGAVGSGLDYQRQASDLQRETNQILREIREASRREIEA